MEKLISKKHMRLFLRQLAFCISLILLLAPTVFASEKIKVQFDGRSWQLGWSAPKNPAHPEAVYDEYVLQGETVDAWTELVTVQFFPGAQKNVSQENHIMGTKMGLQKACPSLVWKDIRVSATDSIYEWNVTGCGAAADQSEIARVVRNDKGIHVWHYAIKKAPMPTDKQAEWIKNLDAIQVTH